MKKQMCAQCLEIRNPYKIKKSKGNSYTYCRSCFTEDKNRFKVETIEKAKRAARMRQYIKNRLKTDVNFRNASYIRTRIRLVLQGKNKSASALELIGCDIESFKKHIASKFKPGMNWNNHGEWEIDHIKPCAKFNLSLPEEQKRCFNYTNTQPLWKSENRSKGGRYQESV